MSLAFVPPQQKQKAPPPNQSTIQKMLDENNQLIQTIIEYQNTGKAQDCMQYQQVLHRNLVYLATIADANQNVHALLPAPGQSGPQPGNQMRPQAGGGMQGGGSMNQPGQGMTQGNGQPGYSGPTDNIQGFPRQQQMGQPPSTPQGKGMLPQGQGLPNQNGNMGSSQPYMSQGQSGSYGNQPMMNQNQPMMSQQQTMPQGQQPMMTQGQQPMMPQGQQPMMPQGQQPMMPQGQQPMMPQGQQPMMSQGQPSMMPQGQQPMMTQGQQPVMSQGQQPMMSQGQQPMVSQGQQPMISQSSNSQMMMNNQGGTQTSSMMGGARAQMPPSSYRRSPQVSVSNTNSASPVVRRDSRGHFLSPEDEHDECPTCLNCTQCSTCEICRGWSSERWDDMRSRQEQSRRRRERKAADKASRSIATTKDAGNGAGSKIFSSDLSSTNGGEVVALPLHTTNTWTQPIAPCPPLSLQSQQPVGSAVQPNIGHSIGHPIGLPPTTVQWSAAVLPAGPGPAILPTTGRLLPGLPGALCQLPAGAAGPSSAAL